ncbi:RICIN domain-containing protein, partial [Actinosynnema sp. NPDC023658]|uniref:RICIN domain-containing protein n=1 Tax=Actinosynnema sp. NPDC023658 TaxID=3155465 RepID=UPI0033EBA341
YVRLVNQNSGKDVVVRGASRDAGAKLIQYSYEPNADTNDEWLLEDAGNGRYRLANRFSGLYLTMPSAQGAQVEQRAYDGSGRQAFTIA